MIKRNKTTRGELRGETGNLADVYLRFKEFLEKCTYLEKGRLYATLCALRGPDKAGFLTENIKRAFTCEIRAVLGFMPMTPILPKGDIKRNTGNLALELKEAGGHWGSHTLIALEELGKAKLLSSKHEKFLLKIRDRANRR